MRCRTSRQVLLDTLKNGLHEMGQSLTSTQHDLLIRYIELLYQRNHEFNLSRIKDIETMISRHLLDSLSIAPYIQKKLILDAGTGAGLPGIPLAIALPQCRFFLLDSNPKKARFLRLVALYLRIPNIKIIEDSVEKYKPDQLYDSVISRSFGVFPEFLHHIQPMLKPKAQILVMKGVLSHTELDQIKTPFNYIKAHALEIPLIDAERHVVEVIFNR